MELLGYVRNLRSLMERTETLCPHATIGETSLIARDSFSAPEPKT